MSSCIWYISKYLTPIPEGTVGARGYLLMREVAALGHRVVLITSDANPFVVVPEFRGRVLRQERDGLTLLWLRTFRYRVAKSVRRVLSWLDFELQLFRLPKAGYPTPDAIVVSSLSLLTVLNGLVLKRKYGCRLVFEVRDIWPLTILEEGGFSRYNPLVMMLGFVERIGYKYADAIVGTMPNLAAHVAEVLGYPKETACIPMGVDAETAGEPAADVLEGAAAYARQHFPSGKFIVAHAGTIGTTNALETFFDCAQQMRDQMDVQFIIIGDGDLRSRYQAQYGHLPNLTFAPRVPKAMVPHILRRCDLLYFAVHPSRVWQYGQSLNKVIDYMMSARPIIASYSGFPSMINEAGCGSFVPAGDTTALKAEILRYRAMSPVQRQQLGMAGRTWLLDHRSYQRLAREYMRILLGSEAHERGHRTAHAD